MKKVFSMLLVALLFAGCKKNPCDNQVCLNGSACNKSSGTCICLPWFEGENCSTEMRAKFIGVYHGQLSIDGDNNVYVMSISPGNTVQEITMTVDGLPVVGQLNTTDHLYIQDQTLYDSGDGYRFIGSGSISGTQLTLDFILSQPDGTYPSNCHFSGSR